MQMPLPVTLPHWPSFQKLNKEISRYVKTPKLRKGSRHRKEEKRA